MNSVVLQTAILLGIGTALQADETNPKLAQNARG